MFLALWWAWNYTAWATDWIDPERTPVVSLLSVLMVASLVMSASIPEAFGDRGETFAVAYVAMQLLRSRLHGLGFGRATRSAATTRSCWRGRRSPASSGSSVGASTTRTRGSRSGGARRRSNYVTPMLGFRLPGAGADADVRTGRSPAVTWPSAAGWC